MHAHLPVTNMDDSSEGEENDDNDNLGEEEDGEEDLEALNKIKPKHTWGIVNEFSKRQMGTSNHISSQNFQSRCYGSLYCVQKMKLMHKLEAHTGCVNCLNFHSDGSLLASGSDDLRVVLWDWRNGKVSYSFDTKHKTNVFQSKFMPLSGDLQIVTCARDGQVRLHQISRQEGLRNSRKLGVHKGACHKLAVLKDQPQVILSAGIDGVVLRHDLRSSKAEK